MHDKLKSFLVVTMLAVASLAVVLPQDDAVAIIRNTGWTLPYPCAYGVAAENDGVAYLLGGNFVSGTLGMVQTVDLTTGQTGYSSGYPQMAHMTGAEVGDYIYTFGGNDGNGDPSPNVYRYSIADDTTDGVTAFPLGYAYYDQSSAYDGRYVWIFGGYDAYNGTRSAMIWRYDPVGNVLCRAPGHPTFPTGLQATSAVWDGYYAYVFGGIDTGGGWSNTVYRFDTKTSAVEAVFVYDDYGNPYYLTMPAGLSSMGSALVQGSAYLFGGQAWGSPYPYVQKFNPVSSSMVMWQTAASWSVGSRSGASAVEYEGKAYVMGGESYGSYLGYVMEFNPEPLTQLQTLYPMGSSGIEAQDSFGAYSGTHAYLMGGFTGSGPSNSVYRIDPVTGVKAYDGTLSFAVSQAPTAWYGDRAYVFGGNSSGAILSDYQTYQRIGGGDYYGTMSTGPICGAGAFAYGDYIYILGGYTGVGGDEYTGAVVRYDVALDSFSTVATLPYETAFYGFAWNGEKAYLVGGRSATDNYIRSIIEFDPETLTSVVFTDILPMALWKCAALSTGDDGYVHIFGGRSDWAPYIVDYVFVFDPETAMIDIGPARLPRSMHSLASIQGTGILANPGYAGDPHDMLLRYRNDGRGVDGYALMRDPLTQSTTTDGAAYAYYSPTDTMYVFGGWEGGSRTNRIYKVLSDGTMKQVTSTLPYSMLGMCAATVGDMIYVTGGQSTSPSTYYSAVYAFDPETESLVDTGLPLPSGRYGAAAASDGTNMYVVGGQVSDIAFTNQIVTWSPTSGSVWTDTMGTNLMSSIAGCYGGYLYVFGGVNPTTGKRIDTVTRYDTTLHTTGTVKSLPYPLALACGGMVGSRMYLLGGVAGNLDSSVISDRILEYDVSRLSSRWLDLRLRYAVSGSCWTPGADWAVTGTTGYGFAAPQRIVVSPLDSAYREMAIDASTLAYSIDHAAGVFDGESVLLFGGGGTMGIVNTIMRYDPVTKAGSTSTTLLPSQTIFAAAAYDPGTGRTYLTGGQDGIGGYFSSSGYFTSDPDAYTDMSGISPMTSVRYQHGMAIIGDQLYAVGGRTAAACLYSVERMDLATLAWTGHDSLTISGVYQPRSAAALASDGQCIYLFGGETAPGIYTNTILRYDPVLKNTTKMWSSLPQAMKDASAVYDADHDIFIIAGGNNAGGYVDDILVYDPRTDTLMDSGLTLPVGLIGMAGVYDAAMFLGGTGAAGVAINQVVSLKYVPDAPSGSDYDSGDPGGVIVLDATYPAMLDYDLVQVSTGQSVINWQLEPGQQYRFDLTVAHTSGFEAVDYVDTYAWFDRGDDALYGYMSAVGGAQNFQFRYVNTTVGGTGTFTIVYPGATSDYTGFFGTETFVDVNTRVLSVYFTPSRFMRWADGCAGGSTPPTLGRFWLDTFAFNDPDSWNLHFIVTDAAANQNHTYDEFGVFKYQEITVASGDPSLETAPGLGTPLHMYTGDVDDKSRVNVRINAPFRLGVNVSDLHGPEVLGGDIMYVDGGVLSGITQFAGPTYANRIYYKGTSSGYVVLNGTPVLSSYYESALDWYINPPGGIAEGTYTGYITYIAETSSDPSTVPVQAANVAPSAPSFVNPWDGQVVQSSVVELQATVSDPNPYRVDGNEVYGADGDESPVSYNNGLLDVYFYCTMWPNDPLGYDLNVASGGTASLPNWNLSPGDYQWFVKVTDGEYWTTSPTYSFTYDRAPNDPDSPTPGDAGTSAGATQELQCYVSDPDGDSLIVTFYNANTYDYIGQVTAPSYTYASVTWLGVAPGTHSWFVTVSDGSLSIDGPVWTFTSTNTAPLAPDEPYPIDFGNYVGTTVNLQCYVDDFDGDELHVTFCDYFYNVIGETDVQSGSYASMSWMISPPATHEWRVIVSDGVSSSESPVWTFTSQLPNYAPNEPTTPYPEQGGYYVGGTVNLQCYAYDPNGDTVTATFYEDGGAIIGTTSGPSGSVVSVSWTITAGSHYWYVRFSDGLLTTYGPTWSFLSKLTNNQPDQPSNPTPSTGGTATGPLVTLQCFVSDLDGGDTLTATFYDEDTFVIGTYSGIVGDGWAAVSWNVADGPHSWWVRVSDGYSFTDGPTWSFTASTSDSTPPSAIQNLDAYNPSSDSVMLTWTSPGDDGTSGTATGYFVRYSTVGPITTEGEWDVATPYSQAWVPLTYGNTESYTVSGLNALTTYWFSIRAYDEADNVGPLSNWDSATTLSNAPIEPQMPYPPTGGNLMGTSTTLRCYVYDEDGDPLTVSFYEYPSYTYLGQTAAASGTVASFPWTVTPGSHSWVVFVNDGTFETEGPAWSFTSTNTGPAMPASPYPATGSTFVGTFVPMQCFVSDPDRDLLLVEFYDAADDSLLDSIPNLPSGSIAEIMYTWAVYGTHSWYVRVYDGSTLSTSPTWTFTNSGSGTNYPKLPTSSSPAHQAKVYSSPVTLSVFADDPDGGTLTVTFYDQSSTVIATKSGVMSGTTTSTTWVRSPGTHSWYVIVSDGMKSTTGPMFTFTFETNVAPQAPHSPAPSSGQSNVLSPVSLKAYCYDQNGQTLTVNFYIIGVGYVGTYAVIGGNDFAICTLNLPAGQTFQWYVTVSDGMAGVVTGPTWTFYT